MELSSFHRKDTMNRSLVVLSEATLSLQPMKTQIVNSGRDEDYLWASLAIFVLTMAVNAAAVVVIGKKEKTGVNQLVVFDCFANVLTALVQMVNMVYLSNWLFDCSGQIRKKILEEVFGNKSPKFS